MTGTDIFVNKPHCAAAVRPWKLRFFKKNSVPVIFETPCIFKILELWLIFSITGATIFQRSRTHLKILGTRNVMQSKFYTEKPQTLGAKIINVVRMTTWRPCYMYSIIYVVEISGVSF
jgi:hypothetical protein